MEPLIKEEPSVMKPGRYVVYDCERYGKGFLRIGQRFPKRIIAEGTLKQAENLAEQISSYYAGCEGMYLVEGHEDE